MDYNCYVCISDEPCLGISVTDWSVSYTHLIISYLKYTKQDSTIYEDNYVDGRDVAITFPKEKRNLIYIFLESMEMTYSDQSVGGAMSENYIPEPVSYTHLVVI